MDREFLKTELHKTYSSMEGTMGEDFDEWFNKNYPNEYDKLKEDNALLIEALKNLSSGLAHVINATPTGTIRNLLTDVNIIALNAIK